MTTKVPKSAKATQAVADPANPTESISKQVDARGLKCPEPVMLLHNALAAVAAGELVHLQATDPTTVRDVRNFCTHLGHTLEKHEKLEKHEHQQEIFLYTIRKKASE